MTVPEEPNTIQSPTPPVSDFPPTAAPSAPGAAPVAPSGAWQQPYPGAPAGTAPTGTAQAGPNGTAYQPYPGGPTAYGPYGAPAYGPYPPVAPYVPYGYVQPRPTNGMAIASLILAFVFAPLAIVLGFVARHQIKRTGESGDGMALAGIIIGIAFTVLGIIYIIGIIIAVVFAVKNDPGSFSSTNGTPI